MSAPSFAPKLIRGGIVLVNPGSGHVERVIALQYNPDTLTRTLQAQTVQGDAHDRSLALRLKGPPIETIKLDAEIDASDGMEHPDRNKNVAKFGVAPQLAALETILYPPSSRLVGNNSLQSGGSLEITPLEEPLALFVWSSQRVVPVRITDFSITEEAFDPALNPIRARISLTMRVLSTEDLGFDSKGGSLYLVYQQTKERLAKAAPGSGLPALGLTGIP